MSTSPLTTRLAHAEIQRLALMPDHVLGHLLEIMRRAAPFDTGYLLVLDPLSGWPVAFETLGASPAEQSTWLLTHPLLAGDLATLARSRQHVRRLVHGANEALIREPHERTPLAARLRGSELRAAFVRKGMLWGGASLMRGPDAAPFEEREEVFLREIAPLVADVLQVAALDRDARRRHHAGEREQPRPEGPGVICIHRTGAVSLLSPSARHWLHEVTGEHEQHRRAGVPDVVWLAVSALERAAASSARPTATIHVQGRSGGWLTIEAFRAPATAPTSGGDDIMVIIGPASPDEIVELRERLYGLSSRERQIADMVLRGLSTRQISGTLAIAESTVQGHLTHIFEKVQVGSRRALIQRLLVDQLFPGAVGHQPIAH